MHFHFPEMLSLLIPWGFLILLMLWSRHIRRGEIQRLGDWNVIKNLMPTEAFLRRRKKEWLFLMGMLLLIFATAGPQFGSRLKEIKHRGIDVFIALDTSRSMLAEDEVPSRIEKAKRSLSLLINKLEGHRVGIIAFAKYAVLQCPLTVDSEAARMFLDILDTQSVPVQGTSLGGAIRLALKSLPESEKGGQALVLLTDGEDHQSKPVEAAKEAKKRGVVIFTIGIGSTKGEVIKKRDDRGKVVEFHKHKGEMVVSRLDDALLAKISTLTGGKYYRASSTDREIDEIAERLNDFEKKEFSSKIYLRLKEKYQMFALLAFLLLLLEFLFGEKGGQLLRLGGALKKIWRPLQAKMGLSLFILGLLLSFSISAEAKLKDHIREGNRLLKKGDLEAARGEFESAQIDVPEEAFVPYNIANTYYLEGNFEEAKYHFEQALGLAKTPQMKSMITYNLGHLLFSMRDKEASLERFKETLKYNPKDIDAKYNIEYIKAGKEPKNPMKQQPKKGKGKGKKGEGDASDQQQGDPDSQDKKRKGDLSKEDAERILQMIQGQESENLENANPARLFKPEDDEEKNNQATEDW